MVDGEAKKNEREVLKKLEEKIVVLLDNTTYENLADILTFIYQLTPDRPRTIF